MFLVFNFSIFFGFDTCHGTCTCIKNRSSFDTWTVKYNFLLNICGKYNRPFVVVFSILTSKEGYIKHFWKSIRWKKIGL